MTFDQVVTEQIRVDDLPMLTIDLRTRRPGLPADWEPAPWSKDYGPVSFDNWGTAVVVEYDDWEWICEVQLARDGRGPRCGPGAPGFHDDVEEQEHDDRGCGAYGTCFLKGEWVELPFEMLSPVAEETKRRVPLIPGAGACLYLVQMHPTAAPLEIKAGFSTNLAARLKTYRTGSPSSQLIAVRPGSLSDENRLLDLFARSFERIGTEVFRVRNVDEAIHLFKNLEISEEQL